MDLEGDWVEATLVQWFTEGYRFRHTAEKWDLKCVEDDKFYRLSLRPNLEMRFDPRELDAGTGAGIETETETESEARDLDDV